MKVRSTIDLNADVGEGFGRWSVGDDAALLEVVSSASVACGFHAGDPAIMRRTCERAVGCGVRVGAHVGYRDLAGFGRRRMDVEPAILGEETAYQLGGLAACAARAGTRVAYVKPHGALYHRCSVDEEAAHAVLDAIRAFDPALTVVGAPGGRLLTAAGGLGVDSAPEGFVDRAYRPDGALVERSRPGAVLSAEAATAQAAQIASQGSVTAVDGSVVAVDIRTLCVHGDTRDAVGLARAVRRALDDAGVTVEPFA